MDWQELRYRLVGSVGRGMLGTYTRLLRVEKEGAEALRELRREGKPVIFVFWHGQLLPLIHCHRNENIVVLISDHADGEYLTRVVQGLGFDAARGSSTRGGVRGLKGILKAGRAGRDLGLTPDGPKGPRHVFKWGGLLAAQLTGHAIVTITVGVDRAWYLKGWDRFMIPKPFSKLCIRYGAPRWLPRDASEETLRSMAQELEDELKAFTLELNPAEVRIREESYAQK